MQRAPWASEPGAARRDIRFTLGQIEHSRRRVQQDAHFGMRSMQAFDGGKQEFERDRVGAGDSYVPRKPRIRALSSSDEFMCGVFHFLR
jgi:peptidyl-tRNA hydrolase